MLKPNVPKIQFVATVGGMDCSGYIRSLVFYASKERLLLPEGSAEQWEWLERSGMTALSGPLKGYDHVRPLSAADPIRTQDSHPGNLSPLYIAFIETTPLHAGHVWFIVDGTTIECYGGHGVGSRPWNARPLPQEVAACYEWPHDWREE